MEELIIISHDLRKLDVLKNILEDAWKYGGFDGIKREKLDFKIMEKGGARGVYACWPFGSTNYLFLTSAMKNFAYGAAFVLDQGFYEYGIY